MENSNAYKVRLESYNHGTSSVPSSEVRFDVMPAISESIQVEYQPIDPIHMPGSFYVYKGTKSSTYEMSDVKLISRTSQEASMNQAYLKLLRGWTKPFFGFGTESGVAGPPKSVTQYEYQRKTGYETGDVQPLSQSDVADIVNLLGMNSLEQARAAASVFTDGETADMAMKQAAQDIIARLDSQKATINGSYVVNRSGAGGVGTYVKVPVGTNTVQDTGRRFLGAPPEVLFLTAYSNPVQNGTGMNAVTSKVTNIYKVPVVITSLNIPYPNDVDYIPTLEGEPFPIIMTISITLVETHSPREYEKFDLFKYRDGILPGF